jgi:BMFP domain-containing protein YqiC
MSSSKRSDFPHPAQPRNTIDFGESRAEAHGRINYWPRECSVLKARKEEWIMSQNRVYDDFARLVTDASEMAQGVRREAETAMKSQLERLLAMMDVVTREEFEAVKQMAAKARDDNKKLSQKLAALQAVVKAEPEGSDG